eukprot:CAMPEP_0196578600 /NCGR_PEP_ID=MMETSP1081-20130531/7466_1 /TAXON_ID=36882 /ORGANISM="Pyramimonas amylifera, Strain CCMP720" /LENGTH=306 /DNA_ID=CAMNT_0041897869 /DNA_START=87 /DNA_END=1007 /DNA_ORIENTATION=+
MPTDVETPKVEAEPRPILKLAQKALPISISCLQEFAIGELLGTGSFARVNIAKHSRTGKRFAMKTMYKREIVRLRQVQHVLNEKHILSLMSHPNIINAYATFNDVDNIYILLEYIPGGELFGKLQAVERFSEKLAMFYAANLICALKYLHSHIIVFRDLKPENILICDNGYLKIADFGFAKEIDSKTWSVCGTPEYTAPEIIQNEGHGFDADWWSLGIIIYEMIVGVTPFYDKSNKKIFANIVNADIEFPRQMSFQAQDLISKLLTRNLSERLGHTNDAEELENHKCFQHVDFDQILKQTIPCPPW